MKAQITFTRRLRRRNDERGATMILIAVGLSFMILAIAALAIDLVVLYSAHNDARLAADAAALAGAKAIANSGFTTDSTSVQWTTIGPIATNVAIAAAMHNKIGGQPIPQGNITVTYANTGTNTTNPQITVKIASSGVPAFFSRIWGNTSLPVGATSVAEVYNPGGSPTPQLPVQSQCVKPWLLPNLDLGNTGNTLFDPTTGVPTPGTYIIGNSYVLASSCGAGGCTSPSIPVAGGQYIPAQLTAPPASVVPPCAPDSCSSEQNIAACSPQPISCSSASILQQVAIDTSSCGGNTYTYTGASCLIHSNSGTTGLGQGQDCMGSDSASCGAASAPPTVTQIFAGANNRLVADGINTGDLLSASDSLVTIPVFSYVIGSGPISPVNPVNVIGFLQAFITSVDTSGKVTIRLVNIAGCGSGVTGSPVQGDGISPVPVHLIGN